MFQDLKRCASYFEVLPFRAPATFPANTLTAQRLLTSMKEQERHKEFAIELWKRYWQTKRDITESSATIV